MVEQNKNSNEVEELDEQDEPEEKEPLRGHVMDVSASKASGILPCGVFDSDGVLHSKYVIGEMTGEEEDLLAGKGPPMPRLNKVILNCLDQIGTVVEKAKMAVLVESLVALDRMVLLLALRRASLGDFYDVKVKCPNDNCKEEINAAVNLADIAIRGMKDDPKVRNFEHRLTTGTMISWHVMTAQDEEWMTKLVKKKEDLMTMLMLPRIDEVNGEKLMRDVRGIAKSLVILKKLKAKERGEIRKLFNDFEGDLDTKVDFTCPECNHEWRADLQIARPDFFFQSAR